MPVPEVTNEPQPPAANFEAGLRAYTAKDYVTALTHFRPLSDQGNAAAQFYLGRMYDNEARGQALHLTFQFLFFACFTARLTVAQLTPKCSLT